MQLRLSNAYLDLRDGLQSAMLREWECGIGFNLLPVYLGLGIILYFLAPAEPSLIALVATPLALLYPLLKIRRLGSTYYLLASLTFILSGMLVAKIATDINPTPIIERQITGEITGLVLSVDQSRRGASRYLIKPVHIAGISDQGLPKKLRLSSVAKGVDAKPGDILTGLARIQPISGPVYPGGYDFSFFAWHEGLGGSGFFMGKPAKDEGLVRMTLFERATVFINYSRISVEQRILRAIPGTGGDVAVALVTGNKSRIPEEVQNSLRATGLAHILAISGLHMALVTLTVIWIVRGALSLFPVLALNYPIKKWAVCIGFLSATTYLMLSGAGIATQRAWVMISVMLLSVLMDRRAITMRSVAVSALIILVISPQSLFSPGFQMSFSAVTALVAGYEIINKRRRQKYREKFRQPVTNPFMRISMSLITYFGGLATTSLIAGVATSFIAAWHFHQVAPLGLLANLLAMPIAAVLVMPFVLFSVLLMPYGLEAFALYPVETGIKWVIEIAAWVEELSPSGNVGLLSRESILLFAAGFLTICVLKTKLRWFGVFVLFAMPLVLHQQTAPDVMISENGRAIAVKSQGGKVELLYPRGSRFVQDIWTKAWSGGERTALKTDPDQCNRERCIVVLPSSKVLHIVYNPEYIRSSCQRADILAAPRLWWVNCRERKPELVLKRHDFEQNGAHAIYIPAKNSKSGQKLRVEKSLPPPTRPWHRRVRHPDEISDTAGSSPQASLEP